MSARPDKYGADPLADLLNERQELNWLIEHWIEQGTLALLVGPEGSFKSFVAIDWTMRIASGTDWQGCRVAPGRVLYIAGEGRIGVIRRMRGWLDYYEARPDNVYLGQAAVQLVSLDDMEQLAAYLKEQTWSLIVIDTLARNFGPGSENEQETMSAAIKNADRVREATGATVLLVHHTPLEGRNEGRLRPRGSSALSGAADAIVTCQVDSDAKVITVASTKQKDAPNPEKKFLSFDVVDLAEKDNFGNAITTVVLHETHLRPTSRKSLGKNQRRLIQEISSMANGKAELPVNIRDVTDRLDLRGRQSRKVLEAWFREQPWSRPCAGGHIVDLEGMPRP